MQPIIDETVKIIVEIVVAVLGILGGIALTKVRYYLDGVKKKDELHIVDKITDLVVQFAEAELTGAKGAEKRSFAAKKATEILASKGITISQDEILAGIEDGVNKLKLQTPMAISYGIATDVANDVAKAVTPEIQAQPVTAPNPQ